jgi:ATP-dependent Clp protease ATP-binding subunit ClpC
MDAENVMMQSQLEAKKFGSDVIKTEHLVMAMVRAKVINNMNYSEVENILNDMNDNMNDKHEKSIEKGGVISKKTKTPVLDEFSTDLTKLAIEGKLDPVIGRSKEIKRIAQVLSRRKKNNPVLIGEPGCVIGDTLITIRKVSNETNHNIIIIKNDN